MTAVVALDHRQGAGPIRDVALSADPRLAARAGRALRALGEESAASEALVRLAQGLQSEDANDRRAAITYLTLAGGQDALSYLQQGLDDPDPSIRGAASAAMGAGVAPPSPTVVACCVAIPPCTVKIRRIVSNTSPSSFTVAPAV